MINSIPVIAIFDIGKTNKKLFLFNEDYRIVYEKSLQLPEIRDEDGDCCEDLGALRSAIYGSMREIAKFKRFDVKAINFSAYGASLVYIDQDGNSLTPLYSYFKPFPAKIKSRFYEDHGGENKLALETASPVLGSLNSGLQLYRIKYQKASVWKQMKFALHLPQYLSYLFTDQACSDITSIGCHTALWDFSKSDYHRWVYQEQVVGKLAPVISGSSTFDSVFDDHKMMVGSGLHDSSAALIPYLVSFTEPFVLLSTGTWNISLNPFDQSALTAEELDQDCLNYLQYKGLPVKASRLLAGFEYDQQVKRIATHFNQDINKYREMEYDPHIVAMLTLKQEKQVKNRTGQVTSFANRDLEAFTDDCVAYHQLMIDIVVRQKQSTCLVLKQAEVKNIFVDGGFSNNPIFMALLAAVFPDKMVYAAWMPQATALGAALAIHSGWNKKMKPKSLIKLKDYSSKQPVTQRR